MALLHDRFADEVNRLVWRLLGADQDHDDIVQEVFFLLLTKVQHVRDASKLSGWVRAVTVNAVRGELRKRSFRRVFFARESPNNEPYLETVDNLEARDLLKKTYEVLAKMGTRERLVFTLRHIEERPMQEVAELCDCSLTTAKRCLRRALSRFEVFVRDNPELAQRLKERGEIRRREV
jgi:RNA polymerase sigma-70 factor (ECF subfamily)